MRGITETTRGSGHYPVRQSIIAKRNATETDLQTAREQYIGQLVKPTPQSDKQTPPDYRCAEVRLESSRRLVFDLVRADRYQAYQQEVRDA